MSVPGRRFSLQVGPGFRKLLLADRQMQDNLGSYEVNDRFKDATMPETLL